MILVTYFFRNHVRDANRRIRTAIARINGFLQEHISGMAIVQLFNREPKARAQFADLNRVHMEAYKDAIDAFSYFYPRRIPSVSALRYSFGPARIRIIAATFTLGMLISFIQYAQRFFRPIQDLSEKFNILQTAMASSERIFGLLDEPVTIASRPAYGLFPRRAGKSMFASTGSPITAARRPNEDWYLRNVPPRGTGADARHCRLRGGGKATIVRLLLRFYDIQRGQILLDGVDIREFSLQDLRRLFGIVLQDPFLFTGTLESNVKLGTPAIDRAAAERALRKVGLGPSSIRCRKAWKPRSRSAARLFRRASGSS